MSSELTQATASAAVKKGTPTVEDILRSKEPEIARVLGNGLDPAEFVQNAITTLRNNPQLMRASLPSLLGALYLAAQLKLRVGGLAPQVHLTPRTVSGELVVVPILDYRGLLHLVHNTRMFSKVEAFTVHENDSWTKGANSERGRHFDMAEAEGDRGKIIGVVGLAKLRGADDTAWVYLTRSEVETDHRPKNNWQKTPWGTHEAAMFRKTAIRELFKWIPNSPEMFVAASDDQAVIRKIEGIEELQVSHDDGEPDSTPEPPAQRVLDPADPDWRAPDAG
jgi:recombination protein RecT